MVGKTELILICLVAVALLAIVARKIRIPYPILLTIGGVVLALVPGLPAIHLEPELVFNLFLPPLLYPAAVYTSWRDFRANLRSILPLAIVLVLLTMTATAYLFHDLIGLPLAVGFVFGAIISPPDAVAALAVTKDLRVPRKIIVILEGESLVNDATSFISFRFAVAAVMTGSFSLGQASLQFLFVAAGGICCWSRGGLAGDPGAKAFGRSARANNVLPAYSLRRLFQRRKAARLRHPGGGDRRHLLRVARPADLERADATPGVPVWEMVTFILNGVLFMLIGLQLPQVIHALPPGSAIAVAKLAILVVSAIVLVRFVWMFGATYLPRLLSRTFRRKNPAPWQQTALIAWTGMRGADSLAGALAIPFVLANGAPFPGRDLILLLTFCVIFGTLVLQGLTLTPLIRWLGIVDDHVTGKGRETGALEGERSGPGSSRGNGIVESGQARDRRTPSLRIRRPYPAIAQ